MLALRVPRFLLQRPALTFSQSIIISRSFSSFTPNDNITVDNLKQRDSMLDVAKNLESVKCREFALILLREAHKKNKDSDEKHADQTFDALDSNRDGMVTRREFNNWFQEHHSGLVKATEENGSEKESDDMKPIPKHDLALICIKSMIPYIGFGICDNALMIICGDLIDQTIGVKLSLSTMAAAGFGNMISCSTGVFTGGVIDRWVSRLGLPSPDLTTAQREGSEVRNAILIGSLLGITTGCLIGMFPLFFMDGGFFKKDEGIELSAQAAAAE